MQEYKGYKMELNWDASQSDKNYRATKDNHLFFGNSCKELKEQIDNENGKNKIEQIRELIYEIKDGGNDELRKELCKLERQLRAVQNLIEDDKKEWTYMTLFNATSVLIRSSKKEDRLTVLRLFNAQYGKQDFTEKLEKICQEKSEKMRLVMMRKILSLYNDDRPEIQL